MSKESTKQAQRDAQTLTLEGITYCCSSIELHLPLTDTQLREAFKIYERILALQKEVVGGLTEGDNGSKTQ